MKYIPIAFLHVLAAVTVPALLLAQQAPEPPWAGLEDVHLDVAPRTGDERAQIASEEEEVLLSGGEVATLRRPAYTAADLGYGPLHPDAMLSPRVAPEMIGMGLMEATDALAAAWADTFADTLRTAGEAGNATYLAEDEAVRAVYTQLLSGLEFTADQRLGAPMGTFDRPRPARAGARRSGRRLRNVVLATEAAHDLATATTDRDLPETDAAMGRVRDAAVRVEDPAFQNETDPQDRLRIEVLGQAVRSLSEAIQTGIGAPLGIAPGFNSQDGD